jgi:FAD/FMN-containing dehydrogenase
VAADGIVWRGQTGYERLRRRLVWNARLPERYPAAIVSARGRDEVVAGVALAREHGLRLALRSGHSWCAAALRDGALVLDLSGLSDLSIDVGARLMTVGPGLTSGALSEALAERGLGFPVGHCRDVGLGGYLLAGGLGWNGGTWGAACHSVVALEAVTADGAALVADEERHSDLLWAARGAGPGFFAAVTSFTTRVFDAPGFTATSSFAFAQTRLGEVASWVTRLAATLDRRLELTLFLGAAPASLGALGIAAGEPVVVVTAVAFGASRDECDGLLAPFEEGIGARGFLESEARRETPQHVLYEATGARLPAGRQYAVDCLFSGAEPQLVLEALGVALRAAPSASSWILATVAPAQPPVTAAAPAAFAALGRLSISLYAVWDDPVVASANLAWLRQTVAVLEPLTSGSYAGEADLVARPGAAAGCYTPAAWRRLAEVRERYDPDQLFSAYPELD